MHVLLCHSVQDYLDLIENPMDLGTVGEKLAQGRYLSQQEFLTDMRLIFGNSHRYNPKGSKVNAHKCSRQTNVGNISPSCSAPVFCSDFLSALSLAHNTDPLNSFLVLIPCKQMMVN